MKRMMGFFVFITVFVGVCFAGNFYILRRLASLFGIKPGWRFYAVVIILSVSYVAATISEAFFHNFLTRLFYIMAAGWLGVGLLFIFALLVFEPVWLFWKGAGATGGWVVVGMVGALSVYSIINAQLLFVRKIKAPAPVDMKLVQLSDIHIGSVGVNFLSRVVEKTNQLKPDVVLITGDLMDPHGSFEREGFSVLNNIEAPVFFVTGNHERYADPDRVGRLLQGTKVKWLRNEAIDFNGVQIIGIDDSDSKRQVAKRLEGIEVNHEKFNVLMYHRPNGFEAAAGAGVDLMLTGHTHNGQIFPFNFFVRLFFRHMKGLYEHNGCLLYVSPGTGTWGPRMRLGSRSEIVLIELKKEKGGR
jgi:predicted MPP superfamily phosphohydrolase